jgi:NADH-quinone oxidoreductase subunit N
MSLSITWTDVLALGPIVVTFAGTLLVVILEGLLKSAYRWTFWITLAVLTAAGGVGLATVGSQGSAFGGTVLTGGFASYFAAVFCVAGILVVLLSQSYLLKQNASFGEYYALLLAAMAGMMTMAASNDLVVFFLGLETMSIPFYVLAGFTRGVPESNEASLKYFLFGAFATGFLLYGIALVYGTTGSTGLPALRASLAGVSTDPVFVIGLGLMLTGFVFKIAAVPFHMWVPDVYEGAPTTVSGFMSTGGKAAAFAAFILVFAPQVLGSVPGVRELMAVIAALSMIFGNVIAVAQSSIKRMLAYSSIAHAGYILTGVVAANDAGSNGVLFYLLAYTLMNVGAFGVVSMLESAAGENIRIEQCAGLSRSRPGLSFLMAVFMFSLTGIPPFAGFFGKYYVFAGAIEAGYTWLAILGVLMSVVSAYYYLRVVVVMYFQEGTALPESRTPRLGMIALALSAIGLLGLGLFPSTVVDITARFF